MLRRILVPFSELFILLALMFLGLFFISAALGGQGETRPNDTLHMVEIEWQAIVHPFHPLMSDVDRPDYWLTGLGASLAVADTDMLMDGEWEYWGSHKPEWTHVSIQGECLSFQDVIASQGRHPLGETYDSLDRLLSPDDRMPTIPGSDYFSVFTEEEAQKVRLPEPAFANRDAPIMNRSMVRYRLRLVYRPRDLARSFFLKASHRHSGHIQARHQVIGEEAGQTLVAVTASADFHSARGEEGNVSPASHRSVPAPRYFTDGNCFSRPHVNVLYVHLTPSGVTFSPLHPRIEN